MRADLRFYFKFKIFFVLITSIWIHHSIAGMDPYLIRGVDELIAPSCRIQISPVYAMGLLKSEILPHIRFWGAYGQIPDGQEEAYPSCEWANPRLETHQDCPLDSTSALIQSLFPSHARDHLVANQGSKDDFISQLTPATIGALIELILHGRAFAAADWGTELTDLWTLQVVRAFHLQDEKLKQITEAALSDAQSRLKMSPTGVESLGAWIEALTLYPTSSIDSYKKKLHRKLDLRSALAELKESRRWRSIEPWAKILYRALQESQQEHTLYPRHIIERALVSYVLLKESGKESLLEFLMFTPSCLSEKGRRLTEKYKSLSDLKKRQAQAAAFTDPQEGDPELQEFLSAHFKREEYELFLSDESAQDLKTLATDPERLGYFYHQSHFSDLPLIIGGQQAAHKSLGLKPQSRRKYHLYPDCGEASVRNFFNILFYDPKEKRFKPEILIQMAEQQGLHPYRDISKKTKPGRVGVEKGLLAFYSRNAGAEKLTSDEVRDDWSRRVISQLPGVSYMKGNGQCELNSGIDNTLKAIAFLLGDKNLIQSMSLSRGHPDQILTPSERKAALDHLCKIASREGFELSWESETQELPMNVNQTLIFSINDRPRFKWEFAPDHFSLVEIKDRLTRKSIWIQNLPETEAQIELGAIWREAETKDYRVSGISNLWNQKLSHSQVRLNLLTEISWDFRSAPIAYHLTQDLALTDEAIHRKVAMISMKTQYAPLAEALRSAPPVMRARSAAHVGDIQTLNELEAEVFLGQDQSRSTPAHLAIEGDHFNALRVITQKAPQSLLLKNWSFLTPAHLAVGSHKTEALRIIAEHAPETLGVQDSHGNTPAHLAARLRNTEALQLIGARWPESLRAENCYGLTPGHSLLGSIHSELEPQDVDTLRIIAKSLPEALCTPNEDGETLAHLAVGRHRKAGLLSLIAEVAPRSLFVIDHQGNTPAHLAIRLGQADSLRIIAQYARDSLKIEDAEGRNAATLAAELRNSNALVEMAKVSPELLQEKNEDGQSPLDLIQDPQLRVILEQIMDSNPN